MNKNKAIIFLIAIITAFILSYLVYTQIAPDLNRFITAMNPGTLPNFNSLMPKGLQP